MGSDCRLLVGQPHLPFAARGHSGAPHIISRTTMSQHLLTICVEGQQVSILAGWDRKVHSIS